MVAEIREAFALGLALAALTMVVRGYIVSGYALIIFLFTSKQFAPKDRSQENRDKLQLLRQMDRETLRALLLDDLPRWVSFPDVEKCNWLNVVFRSLWPYVKAAVANSLRETLQPALDASKPASMSRLGFSAFDLGTNAPIIAGIKSYGNTNDDEEVMLDLDLLFMMEDPDIVFTVGSFASSMTFPIEMANVKLSGTLRVVLKPLFPRWPTFGAVCLGFTEKPLVEFSLKALHMDVMEVPLLSRSLTNIIKHSLATQCVWPNKIVLPIVDDLSSLELEYLRTNRPLGILQVCGSMFYRSVCMFSSSYTQITNLSLQNIKQPSMWSSMLGTVRYQLRFHIRNEGQTTSARGHRETIKFLSPKRMYILVLDPQTDTLNMTLVSGSTQRVIGDYWISLQHLEAYQPQREVLPLGKLTKGTAQMTLTWLPFVKSNNEDDAIDHIVRKDEEWQSIGALFVRLHRAEELRSMDYNGLSDPYIVLKLGEEEKKSTIKRKTLHPVWDPPEKFDFLLTNPRLEALTVVVMDKDYMSSDDRIGQVSINLYQVYENRRMAQLWSLESHPGSVFLELEWRGFQ